MNELTIRPYSRADHAWADAVLDREFGGRLQARRGALLDVADLPGLVAEIRGERVGFLTYRRGGLDCELAVIWAASRWRGIGTALLDALREAVVGSDRIWLVTTNDNVDALRFYQKRGFVIRALRIGAVDAARRTIKPRIPEVGDHGIPTRDEIELELRLTSAVPSPAPAERISTFYDLLAPDYHLIYADWLGSVRRQSAALDRVIASAGIATSGKAATIWDCACGIGTQALGLAVRGYPVHATDLSAAAVDQARRNAATLGVADRVTFDVVDLRRLTDDTRQPFDVVIACDNALPHLLTDDELDAALNGIRGRLRPGGKFVASIRDYDRILAERPGAETPRVIDGPEGRRIVFQVWDWSDDGRTYELSLFLVQPEGDGWTTKRFQTTYRALTRAALTEALRRAGFADARWLFPGTSGFFQPMVVARV